MSKCMEKHKIPNDSENLYRFWERELVCAQRITPSRRSTIRCRSQYKKCFIFNGKPWQWCKIFIFSIVLHQPIQFTTHTHTLLLCCILYYCDTTHSTIHYCCFPGYITIQYTYSTYMYTFGIPSIIVKRKLAKNYFTNKRGENEWPVQCVCVCTVSNVVIILEWIISICSRNFLSN